MIPRPPALAVLALLLGLAVAPDARAHPHVFVEHSVALLVGADGLDGIRLTWTFDEMFSSMVVLTFDADKDKAFSPAEVKAIEQKHLANLKDYNFFVHLRLNDKPVQVTAVVDFRVRLAGGQVIYEFTVPLRVAAGTVEIAVSDPTFYSAFALNQRAPIQVQSSRNYRVDCRVAAEGGDLDQIVKCSLRRQAP